MGTQDAVTVYVTLLENDVAYVGTNLDRASAIAVHLHVDYDGAATSVHEWELDSENGRTLISYPVEPDASP
jgi:hypothetical protein